MESENSSWTLPTQDSVYSVEFSPFEWSSSLLAAGTTSCLYVFQCKFRGESDEVQDFSFEAIRKFNHGTRIQGIAWSPETSLAVQPKIIRIATAGADRNIRLILSNLKNDDSILVLEGHTDSINSITFEPDHGTQLASTSDDHTCRIWNLDGTAKSCLTLSSPGMSVCWHKNDSGKILVAQKNGIIRFYNLSEGQPIMSLDCGQTPLMSADWCPRNNLRVGGTAGSSWFVWDISCSSHPSDSNQVHTDGALKFRWAHNNENIFATSGRPRQQVKVTRFKQNQIPLQITLPVGSGISWHCKLSVLAVVGDKKVHIFKIDAL